MFVGFGIGKGERIFTRVRVMSYELSLLFFRENSLKQRFFLLNSLKQRLANDSFLRILFMQITISIFPTSTSSPRYHLAFFRA